ncbi:MAG: hypothetical protein RLZZ263_606 [Cyanobacteriota bacterium]|jgi:uncharacterized protein
MADLLRPISIADLKHLEAGKDWQVDQPIDGLNALTPVRGHVQVHHQGSVLAVKGHAETSVSLCCDRCLQPFNHALAMEAEELIGLGEAPADDPALHDLDGVSLEEACGDGAVYETLDPRGSFDPERWVFEQLSLQWPLVNHCGSDCPGPDRWSSQGGGGDPRWAALGRIGL